MLTEQVYLIRAINLNFLSSEYNTAEIQTN